MKTIRIGAALSTTIRTKRRHSADQFGNPGLYVVATPALIWLLEEACHQLLLPFLDQGEGTVGTTVNVEHVAAAPEGALVQVEVVVQQLHGPQVTFEVRASEGKRLLMHGIHRRSIVRLEEFHTRMEAKRARKRQQRVGRQPPRNAAPS